MPSAKELLTSIDWPQLDHCGARNLLERHGWRFLAAGDWAVVLGDPERRWAARISPFELAQQHFVELCRRLPDNPYLPAIILAADLDGGGHLTIMERLTSRDGPDGDEPDPLWESADPELRAVRAEAERIDHECRTSVPWWGGLDVKSSHVMTAADGSARLVDLCYVDGGRLSAAASADYAAFCRVVPPERHRHLLQLPHFSQPYAREQLRRLRAVMRPDRPL